MRLFIAEKPELAEAIKDALGNARGNKGQGYYVCGNGQDVVTWCWGHMLKLKEPQDYDKKYEKWALSDLPFSFIPWSKKVAQDKKDRVTLIKKLIQDADTIVNAGDPDDEGQLLIDELLEYLKCNKPTLRLLINDINTKVVQKALANLKPNSQFTFMGAQAEARSVADQLYGFNLSRAYTLTGQNQGNSGVLTVGRVQTPILGLVVRRCRLNASHEPSFYYTITGKFEFNQIQFKGRYLVKPQDSVDDQKRLLDPVYAQSVVKEVTGQDALLSKVVTKAESIPPVLPYNLLKLQSDAARKFGLNPDQVLAITQNLRVTHKLITYNRSDCQYLSDEQHEDAPHILAAIAATAPVFSGVIAKADPQRKGRVFNSAKVSAHHAIVPTEATADFSKLTQHEQQIYLLIARAYIAQFYPDMKCDVTSILTHCNGHDFATRAKVITQLGWKQLYKNDADNEELQDDENIVLADLRPLVANSRGQCLEALAEKQVTKPPKLYTYDTLLNDLTRVAKYIKDPALKQSLIDRDKDKQGEHGGIGTPATRSVIIKNLFERGYLQEKGKSIISTELGEKLYDALPDIAKFPDMTAVWHDQIKHIKTKAEVIQFIHGLMDFIGQEVVSVKSNQNFSMGQQGIPCPHCHAGNFNRIAISGKKPFWACSDRENCGHMLPDLKGKPDQRPKPSISTEYHCLECGKGLIKRSGISKRTKRAYSFWACSGYPGCKQNYDDKAGIPLLDTKEPTNAIH